MRHFYRDVDHQVTYVQGIQDVRGVIARLESCNPLDLLTWKTDCFGEELVESTTLTALQTHPPAPEFECTMRGSLSAVVDLLKRQYRKQFEETTEELIEVTKSSRVNNIHAEQVMGMLSASMHRAPAATVAYHSAKIRAQKNSTLRFLEDHEKVDDIIAKARIHCSKVVKKENMKNHKMLLDELTKRSIEKEALKDTRKRRKMEKQVRAGDIAGTFPQLSEEEVNIVKDIMAGGVVGRNICHTWDDGIYSGRINKYLKSKKLYKIAYWSTDGEDPTDYELSAAAVAVDFICRELTI